MRWLDSDCEKHGFIKVINASGSMIEHFCHERNLVNPPDRSVPPVAVCFDKSLAHTEHKLDDAINVHFI